MRKIIIIFIGALFISHVSYLFLERGIKKFSAYSYPRLVEIIEGKTNYDVLFFGTSRTQVHINPRITDSILNLNTYNAGKAGASSLEVRMLIEAYLKQHKAPKYIVYNIDHLSILNANKVPNSALYLFFLNNEAIEKGLQSTYNRVYLMKYIPFTRIMNLDDYYRNVGLQGNMGHTEVQKGPIYYKGFASNDNSKLKKIKAVKPIEIKDPSLVEMNNIIDMCNQHGIKLIFHYGPVLFENGHPTSFQRVPQIEALAHDKGIDFLTLDTVQTFQQSDFFDMVHLNRSGTEKYTVMFAKALKPMLAP